jgi:CheY-like chemotaxis protein
MPKGGRLTIETANVSITGPSGDHGGTPPGQWVLLSVTDTGVGMDRATMARVFEPFFTTKEVGKGTGLGLSTVYGIVKQSGGYVWVSSEPGRGASFRVYLPQVGGVAESWEPGGAAAAARGGTETVLLVEDEDAVRALVVRTLRERGYQVLAARDGREALDLADRHNGEIHLLLTDVVMPGMGGKELAEAAAIHRPDMRVLFMSGYTDDTIVRHGLIEGSVLLLQKPFTPSTLAQKVREVLDAPSPSSRASR